MNYSMTNIPKYKIIPVVVLFCLIIFIIPSCDFIGSAQNNIDLILIIDESESMLVSDPNGLKDKAVDFWFNELKKNNKNKKNRIGIIRFATEAYISKELEKVENQKKPYEFKKSIDRRYTEYPKAFKLALEEFNKRDGFQEGTTSQVLLISDGKIIDSSEDMKLSSKNGNEREIINKFINKIGKVVDNYFNSKGIIINLTLVNKNIESKLKQKEEEAIWRSISEQSNGFFNSVLKNESDILFKRYKDISTTIFGQSKLNNYEKQILKVWPVFLVLVSIMIIAFTALWYKLYKTRKEIKSNRAQLKELAFDNNERKKSESELIHIAKKYKEKYEEEKIEKELEKKEKELLKTKENKFLEKQKAEFHINLSKARKAKKRSAIVTHLRNGYKNANNMENFELDQRRKYYEELFKTSYKKYEEDKTQSKNFNEKKHYFESIKTKDTEATLIGISNVVCEFITEKERYVDSLFEDIIIFMHLFDKNSSTDIFGRISKKLSDMVKDYSPAESRKEYMHIMIDIYGSFAALYTVEDKNVQNVLERILKAMEKFNMLPAKDEMIHEKNIYEMLFSIYNKFRHVFISAPQDNDINEIYDFSEELSETKIDPYLMDIYISIIDAIQLYILKKITRSSVNEKIITFTLGKGIKEIYYYETIEKNSKKHNVTLPLYISNNSHYPVLLNSIEIIPNKESGFHIHTDDEIMGIIVYPTRENQEYEVNNNLSNLFPIRLKSRDNPISNNHIEAEFNIITNFCELISLDNKKHPPKNIKSESNTVGPIKIIVSERKNEEIERYNNDIYQDEMKKPICKRKDIDEFVESELEKATIEGDNSIINLFGTKGTGKSTYIEGLREKIKNKYLTILLRQSEDIQKHKIDIIAGKLRKASNTNLKTIIVIDEYETVFSQKNSMSLRSLNFFFSDTNVMAWIICSQDDLRNYQEIDNNLANLIIAKRIEFFTEDEAQFFFSKINFDKLAIESMMKETGGHPALLRDLWYEIVKFKKNWKFERPIDFWVVQEVCKKSIKHNRSFSYLGKIWDENLNEMDKLVLKIIAKNMKVKESTIKQCKVPMILDVSSDLIKTTSKTKMIEDSTDIIRRLVEKRILKHYGSRLDFQIDLLRKWIYEHATH